MENKSRHHDCIQRISRQRHRPPPYSNRRNRSRSPHRVPVHQSSQRVYSRFWSAHKKLNHQHASSSSEQEYSRNEATHAKSHPLIQSKVIPQECRLCGSQNITILGSVPAGTFSLILCELCRWELHDTSLWDPMEWQPLIERQATTSIVDGMEHRYFHNSQQLFHSEEGEEHGGLNEDLLMTTRNVMKTSNRQESHTRNLSLPRLMAPAQRHSTKSSTLYSQDIDKNIKQLQENVKMKSCVQYEPTKEPRVSREPWESTEPLEIKEEHDVAKTVQEPSRRTKHRDTKLTPAQLVYSCYKQYKDILVPIVHQEADYQEKAHKLATTKEIDVTWIGDHEATFLYPSLEKDIHLTLKSGVHLTHTESNFSTTGRVSKLLADDTVHILVHNNASEKGHHFSCYIEWNPVPFYRMKNALKLFATPTCKLFHPIKQMLLGQWKSEKTSQSCTPSSMPSQFAVHCKYPHWSNGSQKEAIQCSLQQPLCLIQGPPGTGKTATAAAIVHNFVIQQKKVLVCAPSNSAVDNLCLKIATEYKGLKVVRVCSKAKESSHSSSCEGDATLMTKLTLHHKLKSHPRYKELMKLSGKQYHELERRCEISILQDEQVVCCTCVAAGDSKLLRCKFEMILVDECCQATEPECMIPIVLHGREKVILIGDHCQLGPVVMDQVAASAGLQMSLFERLIECGNQPVQLNTQYRMHPAVSKFPSQEFYSGKLKDGVKSSERKPARRFPWPDPDKPNFFWDYTGKEDFTQQSFSNNDEAMCVGKVIDMLLDADVVESCIGVITPYNEQRKVIKWCLPKGTKKEELEIDSVDGFQGREKDYIILSCVRSNEDNKMGFLNDRRRLNVALTRARKGLIIIGNASLLSQDVCWHNLIQHYKERGLLVCEGKRTGRWQRIHKVL